MAGRSRLRRWAIFISLATTNFITAMTYSVQAPIYPTEAVKKGASATEFGLVLATYELGVLIAAPIAGTYVTRIGLRKTLNIGILIATTSIVCFGFLNRLEDLTTFLTLSFILRITESIGSSGISVSVMCLAGREFPDSIGTVFGALETLFGVGCAVGPFLGSALFELGGFTLPFVVIGVAPLISAAVANICISGSPATKDEDGETAEEPKSALGFLSLLKTPAQLLYALCVFVAGCNLTFITALLQPHLATFDTSQIIVGTVFLGHAGVYALASLGLSWMTDRTSRNVLHLFVLSGATISLVGYCFIGPLPFIPIEQSFWLTVGVVSVVGIGFAGLGVTPFKLSFDEIVSQGYTEMDKTSGLVSSLWLSCMTLGGVVGPTVAGILFDEFQFRGATVFIAVLDLILIVLFVCFILHQRCGSNSDRDISKPPTSTVEQVPLKSVVTENEE